VFAGKTENTLGKQFFRSFEMEWSDAFDGGFLKQGEKWK